jgi:uncharacterized protein YhbP (UPF0306 family)
MDNKKVEQTIRNYLPQVIHMSLATTDGTKPWVCEVHYAVDDGLNFYFRSRPSRRHSLEIAKNPNVAGSMVTQHHLAQGVRGVYFEGTAELLENVDENHIAYKSYADRFGRGPEIIEEAKQEDGHKFYKITPTDFYLFDSYETVPGQKFHLAWNK